MTLNQHTLLLVEDEADQRNALTMMFEGSGYNVLAAESAENALDLLKNSPVHLIVSDLKLTGMDGFTFYDTLRAQPALKSIPFMFITAYNDPESIARVARLDTVRYITKPYDLDDLLDAVRERLDGLGRNPNI